MHLFVRKTLWACGLVILTGPLCFTSLAQGYVDLEAERAAAEAAGNSAGSSSPNANASAPADPYGAQPTQAYPATSYGVNNAPAAPAAEESAPAPTTFSAPTAAPTSTAGSQMGGSDQGRLYLQIQQLQQEVMRLNGKLEEQAYELSTLKEQSLQRYMDLDKRLGGAGAPSTQPGGGPPVTQTSKPAVGPGAGIDAAAPVTTPVAPANRSAPAAQPASAVTTTAPR